ncbi:unnamed protein product [Ixodes hexagonus]
MRSEWNSQCSHRSTTDQNRKEPESSSSGISTSQYTLTSTAVPRDLAHSRDVRTSDLDSSVISSSSTSSRDQATAGDTGYGETSSSEEQDSSWSRSERSSSSSSSSSETTTASGALASVSDDRDDTDEEDRADGTRDTDPDTELVTSEQISSTDAEDTRSMGTEDLSEVTTASESRIDDDKTHVLHDPDIAAASGQAGAEASAEAHVEATAEVESEANSQADPDTSVRSQGDIEGEQSSEAGPSSAPRFLRPTIEIDSSDILHKAKPEIDEGDFGVGPSYKKMTEAEFVAQLSIHEAARTGDLHVIKLLLKSDSKRMETVDERGWTPIHLAAANGQSEVVRYLALEGADVAALDPTSYTAMHLAAMNGHNSCLEVLLKVGADVDNITADGFTPLHLAALNNYADCARTLLSWGANLAIEDALGRTVQDMVEEYALDDVSTLLSGLWTHIDKYRQSGKQNGQSGNSRKRSTRKLVQMAASSMGQD